MCVQNGGAKRSIRSKEDKSSLRSRSSEVKAVVVSVVSDSCDPVGCSPPASSVHGVLQARMPGWVAYLLQGILLTQGSNLGLLHLQADSLPSEPPGKPNDTPGKTNLHSDLDQGSVSISVRVNSFLLRDGKENTINQKPGKWLLFLRQGLRAGLCSCRTAHSAAA